ncbi:MAG: transglycosylase domain-containing protein [Thermoanaerobaculia bacterium]|nr:transglycosylase domain-containing protein [Thermoanaerobaculia bacterium]
MRLRDAACYLLLALALTATVGAVWLWRSAVGRAERIAPGVAELAATYPVSWSDLTRSQRSALLAVEDPRFFEHRGIDVATPGAGLTTITQGLVKRLAFDDFRPGPVAKLRQSLIARALDRRLSKEDQLTLFVNQAAVGSCDGVWLEGLPAAAEVCYGRALEWLEEEEYLTLVARLVAPGRLSDPAHADELAERVRRIQRLLRGECEPRGLMDLWLEGCAEAPE